MKKNILVIIGGRGIGDLIYHLPLLKSLYKTYKSKIFILSNRTNQAKEVFKNEIFYKKIIYFDNQRLNLFKTIKNIFKFKKIINSYNPKYVYLTSNARRLTLPVLFSSAKKKFVFGKGNFIINKDNSLRNLTFSQKILKYTYDLNLPEKNYNFTLNHKKLKKIPKSKRKKFFIVLDSHHDQNNWPIENFIKIIEKLIKKNKLYINFSPNKKYFLNYFSNEIRDSKNIEFTYKKKISEIIKIIYSCDVIIGNETGPICLGSALKKKVHAIYTPLHTLPESKIISKKNIYYNTYKLSSKHIIKKILSNLNY